MRGAFFILLILVCLSLLIFSLPCDIRDTVIIEGLDTSFHYRSNTIGELNVTIVKEWEALGETIHPFKSKDEMVVEIRPNPVDYKQNNDVAICRSDTYLILFYPSRVMDAGIRKLIRRNVPQGVIVNGKRVNRVFVIAVSESDKEKLEFIQEEKAVYGDIVISLHQDSLASIAQSVWDGFLWIRNHCKHTVFAAKVDPDEVIFLGNLTNYLGHAPRVRFYGGNYREFVMKARKEGDKLVYFPIDYPYTSRVTYVSGALIILSMDIIDYIIVGAQYEPFFARCTDDFMIGAVLNRVGIIPNRLIIPNCTLLELNTNPNNSYEDYNKVSNHVVVYHGMKKEEQLAEALRVFGSRILTSTGCFDVSL